MTTVLVLVAGYRFIRKDNRRAHKRCMLGALALGAAFLVVYAIYHANSGLAKFGGTGQVRYVYFTLLITHVLMALMAFFLVPATAFLALSGRIPLHARLARWTLPLWLFVSASGVIIYIMAIHIYPWNGI